MHSSILKGENVHLSPTQFSHLFHLFIISFIFSKSMLSIGYYKQYTSKSKANEKVIKMKSNVKT